MTAHYRLPTIAEAEASADRLVAAGLFPILAISAFPAYEEDGALIFEGRIGALLDAEMDGLKAANAADEDDHHAPIANWAMSVAELAFLTILVRAEQPGALLYRTESLAYITRVWPTCG